MTNDNERSDTVARYADAALRWSGWGSPVGLGLFIASVGIFLVCVHLAGLLR